MEGFRLFVLAAESSGTQRRLGRIQWGLPRTAGEDEAGQPLDPDEAERLEGGGQAHTMLGLCYKLGRGVYKSESLAIMHFRIARDCGSAMGIRCLAECFKAGFGVPFSIQEAVQLYREAASLGDGVAQYRYGQCLEQGHAVDRVRAEPGFAASSAL